jgi:hypothetical protein
MKKPLVTLLLASIALCLHAQNFKERLETMKREYGEIDKVSIQMSINVYENPDGTQPLYDQVATIKRDGENYFYRFDRTEMLMNEKYLLVVDETSRQMMCTSRSVKKEKKFIDPIQANLDSLLTFYEPPILVSKDGNLERYRLVHKNGSIRAMELFLDTSANIMTRIDYYYSEGHYARIEFKLFDRTPVFAKDDFSENKYVRMEKGVLKTTPLYSRFNLALN